MKENDMKFMRRALQLAALGEGNVSPNPMVGAVIVADGKIIGEGFHRRYSEGHAEVNAVASVADRTMLRGATIYVTLEPCSHFGKTPPCARLLIDSGFKRVVVGIRDPFPKVSGRGIAMLREAGIEVTEGILEEECYSINRRFMAAHSRRLPWVMLKWAQSADGFIDSIRPADYSASPVKFSTPTSTVWMHRQRANVDAIIVGAGTVRLDDPSLTVRKWTCRRQPLRVILDSTNAVSPGAIPSTSRLLSDGLPTLVYGATSGIEGAVERIAISPHDLRSCLSDLYDRGMTSVMVEGGATVLSSFIAAGLWDEARIETAPACLGSGVKAPELPESVKAAESEKFVEFHGENVIEWHHHNVK